MCSSLIYEGALACTSNFWAPVLSQLLTLPVPRAGTPTSVFLTPWNPSSCMAGLRRSVGHLNFPHLPSRVEVPSIMRKLAPLEARMFYLPIVPRPKPNQTYFLDIAQVTCPSVAAFLNLKNWLGLVAGALCSTPQLATPCVLWCSDNHYNSVSRFRTRKARGIAVLIYSLSPIFLLTEATFEKYCFPNYKNIKKNKIQ